MAHVTLNQINNDVSVFEKSFWLESVISTEDLTITTTAIPLREQ